MEVAVRRIAVAIVISLLCIGRVFGATGGFGLGLGVAMPRGQFNRYAGDSFTIVGSGKLDIESIPSLGLGVGLQGIFLENEEYDVNLGGWDFTEEYSTNLFKFTVGAEFTPVRSSLQPYAGAGLALYYFSQDVTLKNWLGEDVDSRELSSELDLGLNLSGGLRFYFTPRVAMDLCLSYDKISGMESLKTKGRYEDPSLESVSLDSEFISVVGGVHFRLP
jgi:opacity protein-like surface antigen